MKKDEYTITLAIASDTYTGSGATPLEALQSLPKPAKIFNKGTLTISQGKLKKVVPMNPLKIKQLYFTSPSTQMVRAKWLASGLK